MGTDRKLPFGSLQSLEGELWADGREEWSPKDRNGVVGHREAFEGLERCLWS